MRKNYDPAEFKYPGEGGYTQFLRARGWIRAIDPDGVEARSLAGRYRGEYGVVSQQADLGLRLLSIESTLRDGYPRRKPRGTLIARKTSRRQRRA